MLASKDEHFRALEQLNERRERGEQLPLAASAHLEQLLGAHTAAVAAFKATLAGLSGEVRADFVRLLGQVNEGLGGGALPPTRRD